MRRIVEKFCFDLQTDGERKQRISDAGDASCAGTHARMAHRRRMRGEAFDSAEQLSEHEHLERGREAADIRDATFDRGTRHAPDSVCCSLVIVWPGRVAIPG